MIDVPFQLDVIYYQRKENERPFLVGEEKMKRRRGESKENVRIKVGGINYAVKG